MFVLCSEPGGNIARHVRRFIPTDRAIAEVADKLQSVPNFLDSRGLDSLKDPTWQLMEVDDVGMFMLDHIHPGKHARIHAVFWDKRLRGREELGRRVTQYWLEEFDLVAIICSTYVERRATIAYVKRCGYQEIERNEKHVHLLFSPWK